MSSATKTVKLRDIPRIYLEGLRPGDLYVHEIKDVGRVGFGPRVTWVEIILRPSTGELFQLHCWDGEEGNYQSDYAMLSGKLPDGVTIQP